MGAEDWAKKIGTEELMRVPPGGNFFCYKKKRGILLRRVAFKRKPSSQGATFFAVPINGWLLSQV